MENLNFLIYNEIKKAFCAYISAELKEYHRLLAVLESQVIYGLLKICQLKIQQNINKLNSFCSKLGSRDDAGDSGNLTLRRLLVWLEQPLDRLKYLNIVYDAIKGLN